MGILLVEDTLVCISVALCLCFRCFLMFTAAAPCMELDDAPCYNRFRLTKIWISLRIELRQLRLLPTDLLDMAVTRAIEVSDGMHLTASDPYAVSTTTGAPFSILDLPVKLVGASATTQHCKRCFF
eukprot:1425645-Amphidinium_carterae.1